MPLKLGYLLSGPLPQQIQSSNTCVFHTCPTQTLDLSDAADLPELYTDVYSVEPTISQQSSNLSSDSFMDTFQSDCVSQDKDGSYTVHFPWKPNYPILLPNLTVSTK